MNTDIVVTGGGHAGVEAACIASRLGLNVILVTKEKDSIGRMSCNPSVGGLAKSRVVREVDVLGGVVGKSADCSAIHYRVLNKKKGPAVQATRCQNDRREYEKEVQNSLEHYKRIEIVEGSVQEIVIENRKAIGAKLANGNEISAKAVILATGTFLGGKIYIGHKQISAGRLGEPAEDQLSESLRVIGLELARFKTGTPPRIDANSIDYTKTSTQIGEDDYFPFAISTEKKIPIEQQSKCFITRTTEKTHRLVLENIDKSALYGGKITGIGPRYCPSIEVKIKNFPENSGHIVFLEPEGRECDELYPNGISNSLPEEIQQRMLESIPGLENARMTKPGYAIEYDVVEPLQARATLELKDIENLYLAGQIMGTSGYEEAAGLGLVAGMNAALKIRGEKQIIFPRHLSYIGVMIDDLVHRGVDEPYRLLTGRAEFRLLLREDNAWFSMQECVPQDILKEISPEYCDRLIEWKKSLNRVIGAVSRRGFSNEESAELGLEQGLMAKSYLRRPDTDWDRVERIMPDIVELESYPKRTFRIEMKYEGYISRQLDEVQKLKELDNLMIPEDFRYDKLSLRREAREKFEHHRPRTIGEASRIPGIAPSEIAVLVGAIRKK